MKAKIVTLFSLLTITHAPLINGMESHKLVADFCVGATSGAAAMTVYTPFHYFQNRQIQELPIMWYKPHYWFRGLPSLALGKAPTVGVQMMTYHAAMNVPLPETNNGYKALGATLLAGCAGGIVNNF